MAPFNNILNLNLRISMLEQKMSELKLIDTYEVDLCSTEPIEIAKFSAKKTFIDNSEVKVGQYIFLKHQGKANDDNGIYYVQNEQTITKVLVDANAYMVHIMEGQKNRHAVFLWSKGVIRRLDLNTEKLAAGNFLTKQGEELVADIPIPSGSIVGTSEPQALKNKTIDIKQNTFLNLNEDVFPKISGAKIDGDIKGRASNLNGLLEVANGGTGSCVLHVNRFLVGNGNGPVTTTKTVPEGDVVGTTDTQNLTNKIISGQLNTIQGISGESIVSLEGKKVVGDINGRAENINGVVDVKHGGTGLNSLPANAVLISGLENASTLTTKPAPQSSFVGQDDKQILTNKTISALQNKIVDLGDDNIKGISGSKLTSDIPFKAAGLTCILPVQNGGTGLPAFEPNTFLSSGHSLELQTIKKVPLGDVVGTSDAQQLTNKTIDAALNSIKNISDAHVAWLSGTKIRGNINGAAEAINGTNDVSHGGTGRQNLPLDCVLIGNATSSIKCEMKAPKTAFVGVDDEQRLTKKTIDARENNITGINSSNISSISGACIQSDIQHCAKNVTGVVDARHGGTGLSKFEARRFLTTSEDPLVLATLKQVPSGDIVGTTDMQILKSKIIDAEMNSITNIGGEHIKSIPGDKIVGDIPGGAAYVHKTVDIKNGGTGLTKLPKGHTIIGIEDGSKCETKPTPLSAFVGTTDEQTLVSKTIDAKQNTLLNIDDKSILALSGSKIIGDITSNAASINGLLDVTHGGTGLKTLPLDEVLIGNANKLKFKKAPESEFVGTSDHQNITNKIIDCQKNALLNISGESILNIPGAKVQGNIPGNAAGIYGVLDISNGGTGLKSMPNGFFLTSAIDKVATILKVPKGEICGTEEPQALINKTINADVNKIENLTDKNIVQVNGSKVTGDINGCAKSVHGVVGIANGGTGGKTIEEARQNLGIAASGNNKDIKSLENIEHISFKTKSTNSIKICVPSYAADWSLFLPACDGPEGHVLSTNGFGMTEWSPAVPCFSKVGYVDAQYGLQKGRCRQTIREVVEKEYPFIQIAPGKYRETCFLRGHIKGLSQKEVVLSGHFVICKGSIIENVTFEKSKLVIENDCKLIDCRFSMELEEKVDLNGQTDNMKLQIHTLLDTMNSLISCGKKTEFLRCLFYGPPAIGSYNHIPRIQCSECLFSECEFDYPGNTWLLNSNVWLRFCRLNCRLMNCYLESCAVVDITNSSKLRFANTQIIDFEEKYVVQQRLLIVKPVKDNAKINGNVVITEYLVCNEGDTIEVDGQGVIEYINLPHF